MKSGVSSQLISLFHKQQAQLGKLVTSQGRIPFRKEVCFVSIHVLVPTVFVRTTSSVSIKIIPVCDTKVVSMQHFSFKHCYCVHMTFQFFNTLKLCAWHSSCDTTTFLLTFQFLILQLCLWLYSVQHHKYVYMVFQLVTCPLFLCDISVFSTTTMSALHSILWQLFLCGVPVCDTNTVPVSTGHVSFQLYSCTVHIYMVFQLVTRPLCLCDVSVLSTTAALYMSTCTWYSVCDTVTPTVFMWHFSFQHYNYCCETFRFLTLHLWVSDILES